MWWRRKPIEVIKRYEINRIDIAKLNLTPEDRVIMFTKTKLSDEAVARIKESWMQFFKGKAPEVMVLEEGLQIVVVEAKHGK